MRKRLQVFGAVLALMFAGPLVSPATPAGAHWYSSCNTYNQAILGTSYASGGQYYYSLIYTVPSNSSCSDVNVTHLTGPNLNTAMVMDYRCALYPPGGSRIEGGWFSTGFSPSLHTIYVLCQGVPNGWQWQLNARIGAQIGPVYFGASD